MLSINITEIVVLSISIAFAYLCAPVDAIPQRDSIARVVREVRGENPADQWKRQSSASKSYQTRFPGVTWNNDAWQITTTTLDQGHYQSRFGFANGYAGLNVAAVGPFFEIDTSVNGDNINGWPLFGLRQTFAGVSGFFDVQPDTNGTNFEWLNQYGGESVVSGVPHWGGIIITLPSGDTLNSTVDDATISNFSSTVDAKAGLITWEFGWSPANAGGVSFQIAYTAFASKLFINQALVQLQITPSQDCNASVSNVIDGRSAVRTNFSSSGTDGAQIYTSVTPNGISNVTAWLYATMDATAEVDKTTLMTLKDAPYLGVNDSSIAQVAQASLKAGVTTMVTKYVGIATSDAFSDPQGQAKNASLMAMSIGFSQSLIFHAAEWAITMPEDSIDSYVFPENNTLPSDPNVIESQIQAVVDTFYLLQQLVSQDALANVTGAPVDTNSISVGGLVSDSYGGLVFWDAEVWMQPGVVVAFPGLGRQFWKYRTDRLGQAKANAQTSYQSSKNTTSFSPDAAVFSWTSGRYGNCTGTGPCFDYEYHINGDIAQEFANYWVASGDTNSFMNDIFPTYDAIATFYSEVLTKNGSSYVLTNMTDPDEYANAVDNGGYTMPLIASTLTNANMFRELFEMEPNATFDEQSANIFISKNSEAGIIDEYTGMNGSIAVKQADVVLDAYPLNYQKNFTSLDALNNLDYYAGKQSLNGPGMTYAIFSIIASRVSPSGCSSYTYQQYSTQPYARAPWFQFSEQLLDDYTANGGTHPAYPFLTGHGGAHQVTVFGYLGYQLTPDFTMHVDPTLPPQIPALKYRTVYWQGWPVSGFSNQTHTTLTRLPTPFMAANMTYANVSIPVQIGNDASKTYSLPPNGTLTLSNRAQGLIKTVPGNIAQCVPIVSSDAYQPGQFPFAAIDGAASSKWQPNFGNTSQSMTISLADQPIQQITGFAFDWAQNPPVNATVLFHNESSPGTNAVTAATLTNITVQIPYDLAAVNEITPYMSNTTNVTLNDTVYSGLYATLTIQGNQGDLESNATGASVAEWAILGNLGQQMKVKARSDGGGGLRDVPGDLKRRLMGGRLRR